MCPEKALSCDGRIGIVEVTWGTAMLVVGLIINVVAAAVDSAVSSALFAVGLLLLLGGVLLLKRARRG